MVDRSGVAAVIPAFRMDGTASLSQEWLAGHPLIAYSIAAGRQAETVSRVVVATDDPQVAALAAQYGAEVPGLLSAPAGDGHQAAHRLLDVLSASGNLVADLVVWLPVTAPLRPRDLVDQAVKQMRENPAAAWLKTVLPPPGLQLVERAGPDGWVIPHARPALFESGHLSAYRVARFVCQDFNLAEPALALALALEYSAALTARSGWEWADWVVQQARLDLVYPGMQPRPLPEKVALLVMDFDGVLTDNRVWVDEAGREQVAAYRSDSLGLHFLRRAGIEAAVLSKETNPVVAARCRKMKIQFLQGIDDKAATLQTWLAEMKIDPRQVVFLGNDLNDTPCFPLVGCAVVVADAEPGARRLADLVLSRRGGYGAVRELCDLLIRRASGQNSPAPGG